MKCIKFVNDDRILRFVWTLPSDLWYIVSTHDAGIIISICVCHGRLYFCGGHYVANASFVLGSWEANWSESCLHPLTCDWQFESSHAVMVSSPKHAGFNGFSNDTTFLHSWASDTFTHEHVSDQTTTIHLCVVEGKSISGPLQLWLDKNLCPWCRFD